MPARTFYDTGAPAIEVRESGEEAATVVENDDQHHSIASATIPGCGTE